ncbi:MAG: DUF4382 domain-containing protein [Paludibacter sp.]|nr:DUF4382 domain-containing protein [Paludibacter sp.]
MKRILYFAIFSVVLFSSCTNNGSSASLANSQQVASVFLTDGPNCHPDPLFQGPWQRYISVNLDIVGIQYYAKDSLSKDSVWKAPNFVETTVNVAALANGDSTLLTMINIPAGEKVHKIKFLLGKNSTVVLSDSTVKKLNIRERSDSAIVIRVMENPASVRFSIMLDFDIAHSIVMGPNGNFFLAPIMRGFIMEQCASIVGFVSPKKVATKVFVVNNSDTITTVSDTLRSNMFKLSGLHDGQYVVQFMPLTGTTVTATKTVSVKGGRIEDMGVVKVN